jgi:hypothetical protein
MAGEAQLARERAAVDLRADAADRTVGIDERETERGPADIRAQQRLRLAAQRERAADPLELLREVELAVPATVIRTRQRPATGAGTIHTYTSLSPTANASSGSHSPMSHMCETIRVPGRIFSNCGRNW